MKFTDKGFKFRLSVTKMETIAFHQNVVYVYCHRKEKIYPVRLKVQQLSIIQKGDHKYG